MKTLKELNEKAWYRFLKVLYVSLVFPYIVFLVVGSINIKIDPVEIPSTAEPLIYKETIGNPPPANTEDEGYEVRRKVTLTPVEEKPFKIILNTLKRYKALLVFVIVFTFTYFFAMEFLRRSFYYVVIGKLFPKE